MSASDAARKSELIRFEMALSARVLRYVHDARSGRIDPNRISGYHDFPAKPLDMVGVLKTLAHTQEVQTYLESRHPQNAEYQALRVELEALKASEENDIVVDPEAAPEARRDQPGTCQSCCSSSRAASTTRLGGDYGETLATLGKSETYVPELVPVIKEAQKRAGLKPDGVDRPAHRRLACRHLEGRPDRQGALCARGIALAAFRPRQPARLHQRAGLHRAAIIEGGDEKLKMRVVVGKPTNQTSFFYDEIEQVDYNPYWGVPQSIIVNEMLPRLRRDPGYLDRAGYEVSDSRGRRISSASVNWGAYGSKIPFNVRQTPSEANALGELKILFPNKHAIYMHDTPQKALFERGHARLQPWLRAAADPRGMAAAVLGTTGRLHRREAEAGPFDGKGDAQDPGLRRLFHGVAGR